MEGLIFSSAVSLSRNFLLVLALVLEGGFVCLWGFLFVAGSFFCVFVLVSWGLFGFFCVYGVFFVFLLD